MIHLTFCKNTKANWYYLFCLVLSVVYFTSIVYNLSIADEAQADNDDGDGEVNNVERKHFKDISMTEYVEIKLRSLSGKPWTEVLKSPLVRNYLLLILILITFFTGVFSYAVFKQYQQKMAETH